MPGNPIHRLIQSSARSANAETTALTVARSLWTGWVDFNGTDHIEHFDDTLSGMFGLSAPRPPLSTSQRVYLELLLRRNVERVGRSAVLAMDTVSSQDDLGLDSSSAEALVATATEKIANRMGLQDTAIQTELRDEIDIGQFDSDGSQPYQGAAEGAKDEPWQIWIPRETASDPLRTVMSISYDLAHHDWLRESGENPLDHDRRTTTLQPLCFGLGVLAAEAAMYDKQWSTAGYSGWSMSKLGFYNPAEIGYACALLARLRNETDPAWLGRLRLDAKETAKMALRYFAQGGSSQRELLFDSQRIPSSTREMTELATWLAGNDPNFALAAALALQKFDTLPEVVVESVLSATYHRDSEIVTVAADLLGRCSLTDQRIGQRIASLVKHKSAPVALSALTAASGLGMSMSPFQAAVTRLLNHPASDVVPVARLIERHAREWSGCSASICKQLQGAVHYDDTVAVDALLKCLVQSESGPASILNKNIKSKRTRAKLLEQLGRMQLLP